MDRIGAKNREGIATPKQYHALSGKTNISSQNSTANLQKK